MWTVFALTSASAVNNWWVKSFVTSAELTDKTTVRLSKLWSISAFNFCYRVGHNNNKRITKSLFELSIDYYHSCHWFVDVFGVFWTFDSSFNKTNPIESWSIMKVDRLGSPSEIPEDPSQGKEDRLKNPYKSEVILGDSSKNPVSRKESHKPQNPPNTWKRSLKILLTQINFKDLPNHLKNPKKIHSKILKNPTRGSYSVLKTIINPDGSQKSCRITQIV